MTFLTVPFFTYIFAVIPVWLPLLLVDLTALYMLIFKERMDPRSLVFWISIVFILPFLGFILYLIWGSTILMDHQGRKKAEKDRPLFEGTSNPIDEEHSKIVRAILGAEGDILVGGNKGEILGNLHSSIDGYLNIINSAVRSIHIETRALPRGELGSKIVEHLCRKADEGVDVRIILGNTGFGRSNGKRALKKAGVKVRTFHSAFFSALSIKATNRDQRELHVIDAESVLIGMNPLVHLKGKMGNRAERMFLTDWRRSGGEDFELPETSVETDGFDAQMVRSGPDAPSTPMLHGISEMISSSKERISIMLPYLIPGDEMYSTIKQAALASRDVRIYIPLKTKHWYQYWNSFATAATLVKSGVRVYFSAEAGMTNLVVADGNVCAFGSMTYNIRSPLSDYGLGAFAYSKEISRQAEDYLETVAKGAIECTEGMTRSIPDKIRIVAARLVMFIN